MQQSALRSVYPLSNDKGEYSFPLHSISIIGSLSLEQKLFCAVNIYPSLAYTYSNIGNSSNWVTRADIVSHFLAYV